MLTSDKARFLDAMILSKIKNTSCYVRRLHTLKFSRMVHLNKDSTLCCRFRGNLVLVKKNVPFRDHGERTGTG